MPLVDGGKAYQVNVGLDNNTQNMKFSLQMGSSNVDVTTLIHGGKLKAGID